MTHTQTPLPLGLPHRLQTFKPQGDCMLIEPALMLRLDAGVVDVCLIPEVPFSLDGEMGLYAYIRTLLDRKGHAVICVAEGAGQVSSQLVAYHCSCSQPCDLTPKQWAAALGHDGSGSKQSAYDATGWNSMLLPTDNDKGHNAMHLPVKAADTLLSSGNNILSC